MTTGTSTIQSNLTQRPFVHLGKTLLSGVFPNVDQFGNELLGQRALKAGDLICGGWRGAFSSWAGDWKERSLSHSFIKRNYQSTYVCDQCNAIKPLAATPQHLLQYVYTDFRLDAPWTRTIRSHETYLDQTPNDQITPWIEVEGFSFHRIKWDSAHVILLGTGKDIAASVCFDLVPQQNGKAIHIMYKSNQKHILQIVDSCFVGQSFQSFCIPR